ncbi:pth [Symbiodinium pilosum]|uniref:peptidyl-tRNA hydrolase n=1 Tax=Symbiodinium pilosum TaxID=2952 RepID=A0A812PG13_SYMPI|nr:pth [Symbiodinium pilosum]
MLISLQGKIAAQCGHAVLGAYKAAARQESAYLEPWERSGAMKIALKVSSEEELCDFHTRADKRDVSCYTVRDAGHTQVAPHTRTVCAIGPASAETLDTLGCSSLKLL